MTDTDSVPRTEAGRRCPTCYMLHRNDLPCGRGIEWYKAEARATRSPDAIQVHENYCRSTLPHSGACGMDTLEEMDAASPSVGGPLFMSQPETDEQVFGPASPSVTLDELRPFLIHAVDTAIVNALIEYARLTERTDR